MTLTVDMPNLLVDLDGMVRDELASTPEVVDWGDSLDVATLPIVARKSGLPQMMSTRLT